MATPEVTFHGVVHGNIIALFDDAGLPDGQVVAVTVKPTELTPEERANEEFVRAFGAWADDPRGLDEYLEWNRRQRKIGRREIDA